MTFEMFFLCLLLLLKQIAAISASMTFYESLPECCPGTSNYNPNADTTECDEDNACHWYGQLAYVDGTKDLSYFQTNNIVSLFSIASGSASPYNGQYITITKPGYPAFTALVADTCADSDCGGCCTTNAHPNQWLVDVEYWTAVRNLNASTSSIDCAACDGTVSFVPANAPPAQPTTAKPTPKPTTRQPSAPSAATVPTVKPTAKQTVAPTPTTTGTACPASQAGTGNGQGAAGSICYQSSDCLQTCSSTKAQCTTSTGTIPTCYLACPPQATLNSGAGIPGAKCASQADCLDSCVAPSGSTTTRCTSTKGVVPPCQ